MNLFENLCPISKAPKKTQFAEKTLRNWRCQGRFPNLFVKIGGKVFVDLLEFENIIRDQKKKAAELVRKQGFNW
jgi:hypothetical protein